MVIYYYSGDYNNMLEKEVKSMNKDIQYYKNLQKAIIPFSTYQTRRAIEMIEKLLSAGMHEDAEEIREMMKEDVYPALIEFSEDKEVMRLIASRLEKDIDKRFKS